MTFRANDFALLILDVVTPQAKLEHSLDVFWNSGFLLKEKMIAVAKRPSHVHIV